MFAFEKADVLPGKAALLVEVQHTALGCKSEHGPEKASLLPL